MANSEERLPLVDSEGNVIGSAPRSECHNGQSMLLHPVVHLHLFDKEGRLLLQKRSMSKKIQPGRWDTAVGGHVSAGEDILTALRREAVEEIGLDIEQCDPTLMASYVFQSMVERELINSFHAEAPHGFIPRPEEGEIDELRFWTIEEIRQAIGRGVLTPNFESEFSNVVLPYINER